MIVLLHDLYDVESVYAQLGTFISSLKQGGHSMQAIGVISMSQIKECEKMQVPNGVFATFENA